MKRSNLILLSFLVLAGLLSCQGNSYKQGKNLYTMHCESCHMEDGSGLRSLIPPLANADYLTTHRDEIACIIRNGMSGAIKVNGQFYDAEMAGIKTLTDVQINNIINYINHAWGNNVGKSNVKKVSQALKNCP